VHRAEGLKARFKQDWHGERAPRLLIGRCRLAAAREEWRSHSPPDHPVVFSLGSERNRGRASRWGRCVSLPRSWGFRTTASSLSISRTRDRTAVRGSRSSAGGDERRCARAASVRRARRGTGRSALPVRQAIRAAPALQTATAPGRESREPSGVRARSVRRSGSCQCRRGRHRPDGGSTSPAARKLH